MFPPPVLAEVPAVSVSVQDRLSGLPQPFSFLAVRPGELVPEQKELSEAQSLGSSGLWDTSDYSSKPTNGINSRRF
jgi:hypothetical protein